LTMVNPYVGAVAMSEIHFCQLDHKANKRPDSGYSSLGS
jgi:hypothetical protein